MSLENADNHIIDGKVQNLSQSRVQYALSAFKPTDGLNWSSSSECELSEKSIQSPTVSSIQSDSTTSSSNSKNCEKMKRELQEALNRITKLEELLKQKDERIKLLEEEHARHQIICNPELHSGLYGRKRSQPRRTTTKRRKISLNHAPTTPSPPAPFIPVEESTMKNEDFEVLKSEIKRTHRRARPFDIINEPPPKTTIECSIGLFTTQQEYYRNLYVRHEDLDGPEQFGLESKPIVPNWRVKEISEPDSESVSEVDSDDTYSKRHQKYETEEKKLILKDKLMKETRQKQRPEQFKTFHPYPGDFSTIEVTPALPITLWGHSLPNIKDSTFSLPWFTTNDKVKPKSKV